MLQARRHEIVSPFYLHMMGINAIRYGAEHRDAVIETGATVTPDDVRSLLRSGWREQSMGAWYALVLPAEASMIVADVLAALERSRGTLTAPPLAVAAVTLAWTEALPSLRRYTERDGHTLRSV